MKSLFNKKNLTILGILLVLIGIPLTTFILKNQTVIKSRASNSQEPQNVKITNISDKSFTITYRTGAPSTGSINYGNDKKLGKSELEDVDKEEGSFSPKKIHNISVKELAPNTKYYITIVSGSTTFLNNGAPFEVATGEKISSSSAERNIVKGKIILPDGSAPSEALVYLSAENSQLLSDTTGKDGKFGFSLKELRTDDLSSYFNANEDTVFKIVATNGSLNSTALVSLTGNDSIPTITLSNDYNFTQKTSPIASKSAVSSGFPSTDVSGKNSKPKIISPEENQSFNTQKPQFKGTGLPNEKIEIIINSEEQIIETITADNNGNWTYQPPTNLSPGNHTITIKTRDSSGILTTITQSFTVFAAESQVPEPTASITAVPTLTLAPTAILTPFPSPTGIAIPTVFPTLPPTGDTRIVPITFAAIATTAAGIVLFLLSRKMPL